MGGDYRNIDFAAVVDGASCSPLKHCGFGSRGKGRHVTNDAASVRNTHSTRTPAGALSSPAPNTESPMSTRCSGTTAAPDGAAPQTPVVVALPGLPGGIAGTSLGTAVAVGGCLHNEWTPVLDPNPPGAAPVPGLATGLLAGLYPSWRASRIQHVEALRR